MKPSNYTVTIRDQHGDKIARQITVDDSNLTIGEIIDIAAYEERMERKKLEFKRYFKADYRDWWVAKEPYVPPPPPEPLGFDVLVSMSMV